MRKIKKGDVVVVTKGKDRDRQGVILSVLDEVSRVVVEGVNRVKRHTKPNPSLQLPGGIIEKEASIHISNVALLNKATGKGDRVGFKVLENGHKVRVFKSTQEMVE